MQQNFLRDPTPRRLGKLNCFWYDPVSKRPRIVVGPDYLFSILELVLANAITWGAALLPSIYTQNYEVFAVGLSILSLQNLSFLLTLSKNPSLPPRNPNAHSRSHLNRVKTIE